MNAARILPDDAPAPARAVIGALRQTVRALEGFPGESGIVAFGIPAIDTALGGGLACGALHEIAAAREAAIAAATGFALGLAGRSSRLPASANLTPSPRRGEDGGEKHRGGIVWLVEDMALAESGAPYGPGLAEAGLAPERLVTVAAAREREVLWAMEEALRCRGVDAVIGETRSARIDAVASRRLALAAAGSGALALLIRTAPAEEHSSAATRWVIGAAPGARSPYGLGPPRLAVHLVRNRRGHLGSWTLEWNRECFILATHPEFVAATAFHRPPRADVA